MAENKVTRRRLLELAGGAAILGGVYSLSFVDENARAKPNIRVG